MVSQSKSFSYSKLLPLSFIGACVLLMGMILYFSSISPDGIDLFVLLAAIVFIIILVVIGISPLLTSHEIYANRLVIRQGAYFKMVIPIKYIETVEKYKGKNFGLSIKYRKNLRRLFVLTNDKRMVSVIFKEDMFLKIIFQRKMVREIVLNVNEPEDFITFLKHEIEKSVDSLEYRENIGRKQVDGN